MRICTSYASFYSKQGDIIVSFLISLVVVDTLYIFFGPTNSSLTYASLAGRLPFPLQQPPNRSM